MATENPAPSPSPTPAPSGPRPVLLDRMDALDARMRRTEDAIGAIARHLSQAPAPQPAAPAYYPTAAPQPAAFGNIGPVLEIIKGVFSIQAEAKKAMREDLEFAAEWGAPPAGGAGGDDLLLKFLAGAATGQQGAQEAGDGFGIVTRPPRPAPVSAPAPGVEAKKEVAPE